MWLRPFAVLSRSVMSNWEKAVAPHSSTLAWRIPWTEEPGGLPSMGSHRVSRDLAAAWPTLCDPMDCILPGSSVHGDSPGKNTGGGCHALLQGIFPIQGSNPGLPHCRWILYCLIHQGSPAEALHRAKFKCLGCQETCISKKWGFTQFNVEEFANMVAGKQLILDDCGVKYIPNLDRQRACTHESLDTVPSLLMATNKSYFPVKKNRMWRKNGRNLMAEMRRKRWQWKRMNGTGLCF